MGGTTLKLMSVSCSGMIQAITKKYLGRIFCKKAQNIITLCTMNLPVMKR